MARRVFCSFHYKSDNRRAERSRRPIQAMAHRNRAKCRGVGMAGRALPAVHAAGPRNQGPHRIACGAGTMSLIRLRARVDEALQP